jgi:hypothetical protein
VLLLWTAVAAALAADDANPHGAISIACQQCHSTQGWTPLRPVIDFDHTKTRFPLAGRHVQVQCLACHASLKFAEAGTQCVDCHLDVHHGQFGNACESCHTPEGWQATAKMTERHQRTRFPLVGVHASVNCQSCHANGQYVNLPLDCKGCHLPSYQETKNPDHAKAGFSLECNQCHTITAASWQGAVYAHPASFPLTGGHAIQSCNRCHDAGYTATSSECYSCHAQDYAQSTNPAHAAAQFPHDCAQCHTIQSWRPASFDHNLSSFPLTGAHIAVVCTQCHLGGQYTGISSACWSCHEVTYRATANPDHETLHLSEDCAQCHTTQAWHPASFDHSLVQYPLTGAHVSLACAQCHASGQYAGTPQDCWSCHQSQYAGAESPSHVQNQLPHECQDCHTTSAWQPSTFDHAATNFPLTGAHQIASCIQCHANGSYGQMSSECFSCHQQDYQATQNPHHTVPNYSHDCAVCHTTVAWHPASFDHSLSSFPLTGAHVSVTCDQCHANGQFAGTPSECFACHSADYNQAEEPNHAQNQLPHDCQTCHTTVAWSPSTFNHANTSFPLTGAHIAVNCAQCHVNGQFQNTPTECWSCHQADYTATDNPDHEQLQLSHECVACHTTTAWAPAQFDHNLSGFPLTGAHVSVSCTQCHANGQYPGTPTDCWSCHEQAYRNTINPDHEAGNYSQNCAQCHTTNGWQPATFDHNLSDFPLTGAHVSLGCAQCHINGQYAGTPTDCWSCHQADYQNADEPNHSQNQFPHECLECHTTNGWAPSTFNHDNTAFPLTGAHVNVNCLACHVNGQYQNLATDCWSCHQSDYQGVTDPNHVTGNYNHDCAQCHTTSAWQPATFDHNLSNFPLTGAHVNVSCAQCHVNGQFNGTPQDCWSCHQADYNSSDNPNHVELQLPHACEQCHTTTAWAPAQFDHNLSSFPLTGAHVNVNCAACHTNGQYSGTPQECYACHQADYEGAQNPNHVAGNYSHECATCHTTVAWQPASFDHSATDFPLTGAHVSASCTQCHVNGQYNDTPTECFACHEPDYNGAQDPNHAQDQLPHACQECHTTNQWTPSTFSHDATGFPLTGAHVSANCSACHVNGQFQGTPTECYSCHEQAYTGVSDPNHVADNFSHACLQCHTTVAWQPATFDHTQTQFPLTGAHISASCGQCHANGHFDNTATDCWSCHQSDYQATTNPDHETGNFAHTCEQCHTTAAWTPAAYDHNLSSFPLTGAHVSVSCTLCHINGQFTGTPTQCWDCHQAAYQSATDPDHTANQLPHECAECHTTNGWQPSTFNHNNTPFPLTGAHAAANCAACHVNGQFGNNPTDCWSCHQSDYLTASSPNHAANQLPHDCAQCHSTNAWQPSTFNHDNTPFPLTGAHVAVNCAQCHANGQFAGTPTQCFACHQADYDGVQDPNHQAGQFSHECLQCHTMNAWTPATFDHSLTNFPLTGAHINAACAQCHVNGQFSGTPTDCWSCHQANYNGTTNPNHVAGNYDHNCAQCHTTQGWAPAQYDHNLSGFPLTGAHVSVSCTQCHVNGQYTGTPSECYACHQADYEAVQDPNHVAGNYNHTCTQCHTTNAWQPATIDHSTTGFPLTGAHINVSCAQCHVGGQFAGTPTECFACHQADYAAATNPNHLEGQFPHACAECHSTNSWQPSTFDHSQTQFPLLGAHQTAACLACHVNGQFTGTPTACFACHQADYQNATNPNHVAHQFSHNCETCHSAVTWQPASFDHNNSGFPLTGAHVSVTCTECHINGNFNNTPTDCWSCHQDNYNAAADPPHAQNQIPHECLTCHNTSAWQPSTFDHNSTPFPLTGAHIAASCAQCHTNGQYGGNPTQCFACHEQDYNGTTNPNHVAGQFSHACDQCHTTAGWSPASFDHNLTDFPLQGAHVSVNCLACHVGGQYTGTPTACYACHQADYEGVQNPNHVTGGFDHNCTLCHTVNGWTPATFDHNQTMFPLTGAHVNATCTQCHVNGQYNNTPTECFACHEADYNGANNPNHAQNQLPHACQECHTTSQWSPSTFNHNSTGFPLTGAHINANCAACHTNGQYQGGTPTDCWSCHQADYTSATSPNHAANQFPHACEECHTTTAWQPSTFNHNNTPFPLIGAHLAVQCAQCHINGQYSGTPTDCWSCHQQDYQNTADPNHQAAGFSHNCLQCHNMNGWEGGSFDHNGTGFPLTGAHVNVNCASCHVNNQYQNLATDCWSCHQSNYNAATNPNHVAGNYNHDCAQCHTTQAWSPAQYDHNLSSFPLTGAHVNVSCAQCHINGQYTGTPTDCWSCHQAAYQSANNPNHLSNQLPHACLQCHNTSGWSPSTFNHNNTSFPLTGAHIQANCSACHTNGQYQGGTPTDCWSCHQSDYEGATNPNHASSQLPHACATCHTTNAWTPSTFNHANTGFPLVGAHISVQCAQCHTNGDYQGGTPTDCWSCHQADYQGVTDPSHTANQFSHACLQCHSMNGWSPATFDHSQTQFPLTGAHVNATCAQCHVNGQFQGTPTDCWSCHQADYNGATNPNHVQAQFPHACAECHTTSAWQPSTFNHANTGFPLVGAHISVQCAQCHVNGQYQGTPTDCWSCHQQDYQDTDDPNHEAAGFSHECLQCHNMNGWEGGTFNHNGTGFPLTGAHLSVNCVACHVNNQYQGTPTACYFCHQADYNGATNPNHAAAGFPTTCEMCHNTIDWNQAQFNHDAQWFPIYSGSHHDAWDQCSDCHTNPDNFAVFSCIICHEHNQQDTDEHHQEVQGYSYNSQACYTCHPTGHGVPSPGPARNMPR